MAGPSRASSRVVKPREKLVSAVKTGPINAEVAITLPGGAVVHAVVTQDAVSELGLAPGVPASAVIKASHVVLGV